MYEVRKLEMSRLTAHKVLDRMQEILNQYGFVTVQDYYIACHIAPHFLDYKYGWNDLSNVRVIYGDRAYGLTLPAPTAVNAMPRDVQAEMREQGNYYCAPHFLLQMREITKNESTPFVEVRFSCNDHYCDICGTSVAGPYRIMPPK